MAFLTIHQLICPGILTSFFKMSSVRFTDSLLFLLLLPGLRAVDSDFGKYVSARLISQTGSKSAA